MTRTAKIFCILVAGCIVTALPAYVGPPFLEELSSIFVMVPLLSVHLFHKLGVPGVLEHGGACGWGWCSPTAIGWIVMALFWIGMIWLAAALLARPVAQRLLAYSWAAPYSLLGLFFGLLALLFGARAQLREGAVEFGLGTRPRNRRPSFGFTAITFGHVILGMDEATLAAVRAHEQVHVRQYERWGPLFGPAYLLSSLVQLLRGRRPYRDNRFEVEAFAKAGCAPGPRMPGTGAGR